MTTISTRARELTTDPHAFAEHLLQVQNKAQRFVPLRYNRAQAHYLKHRTQRDLILKARQLGFSTVIQAELFRLYTTGAESVLTMADKTENTMKLRRMAERFYDRLPPNVPGPERSEANASMTTYPLVGSNVQIATAGSQTSGRGSSYTRVHGSEVAYWKNANDVIAGALQAVPEHLPDTWIVFESTANGASGWFYQECMAALRGESDWKLHFYGWWWDDEYRIPLDPDEQITCTDEESALVAAHGLSPEQIKWRRKKQRDLSGKFQQEYPETPQQAFVTSGGGVFDITPDMLHTDDVEYDPNVRYVAGIDWGQMDDWSTLSVMEVRTDGTASREVYIGRWRKMRWAAIRAEIVDVLQRWHVEKIAAEANSMGTSQIEQLIDDIESVGLQSSVLAFRTTNASKDNAVKLLKTALSEEGLRLLDVAYATHEMRVYQTRQLPSGVWAYTHPDGDHDDTIDARLLANYAAQTLWI